MGEIMLNVFFTFKIKLESLVNLRVSLKDGIPPEDGIFVKFPKKRNFF